MGSVFIEEQQFSTLVSLCVLLTNFDNKLYLSMCGISDASLDARKGLLGHKLGPL